MAEAPAPGSPSEAKNAPGAQAPTDAAKTAEAGKSASLPVGTPADYLEIKAEPDRAVMIIKGALAASGLTLTREDVAKKLQGLKVTKGVDWPAVDRMIQGKQFDRPQVIAQGHPPKPGKDASIREMIKIDSDLSPVLGRDGKADYRNVDNIHQVKKGDVLAVKTPMVPGEPGEDIFGKTLPAQAAKDAYFKPGANTVISPDGLSLVAVVGGYVYHNSGAISVGVTYTVKTDVDFRTGNLHYQGDIQVLGNVREGFTVEAEGDIVIEGTVEGAEVVSRGGTVLIKSGVFGHGKGRVAAKSGIKLLAAQDVRIECDEGAVEVAKGLRNCQVTTLHLKAGKPGCAVMGGEIRAYGEVEIADLGGEGCQTHIRILDKAVEAAKARVKEIDRLLAEIPPKLEPLERKLKHMKAMVAKYGTAMSDRVRAELKAAADGYANLKKAEKELDDEKGRLTSAILGPQGYAGRFAVTEKAVWGGILEMYGHSKEIEPADVGKEWYVGPEGLRSRSRLPSAPEGTSPAPAAEAPAAD